MEGKGVTSIIFGVEMVMHYYGSSSLIKSGGGGDVLSVQEVIWKERVERSGF